MKLNRLLFVRLRWYGYRNDSPDLPAVDPHEWALPSVATARV